MQFSIFTRLERDSKKSGFTLIEIIVAISVMTIGILAVYALIPKVVSVTGTSLDRFRASQLAREGVELVRNIRDTNWLSGNNWDKYLTNCADGCEMDYNDSIPVAYQDRYLRIDSNGFYNYGPVSPANPETKFKRKIIITQSTDIQGTDILNVKVQVFWPGKGSPFEVEENLYNWFSR